MLVEVADPSDQSDESSEGDEVEEGHGESEDEEQDAGAAAQPPKRISLSLKAPALTCKVPGWGGFGRAL